MKIIEDVRKFAAEQKISETQALQVGLEQKQNSSLKRGAEVYAKA
jgi:phosphomethylpyrimidine synthase